jgi:hypothetical protein
MSKSYRASNGRFVPANSPAAVIGRLRAAKQAQRDADQRAANAERKSAARRNGYRGPLTREDLARLTADQDA